MLDGHALLTTLAAVTVERFDQDGVDQAVVAHARRLARKSPKTGKARSLRAIAAKLAELGYLGPSGQPYHPGSIAHMLG
jgi:hypothetical protein